MDDSTQHMLPEGWRVAIDGRGKYWPQYAEKKWFGLITKWHDLCGPCGYNSISGPYQVFDTRQQACQAILDYVAGSQAFAEAQAKQLERTDTGPC